jgi:dTDP-4-amino-4,6-dideoxygalactose transaminase
MKSRLKIPGGSGRNAVMPVPLLDLTRQHAPLEAAFRDAIDDVMRNNQFVLGPQVKALEEEVAAYCECRHAIGLSSGTDALLVALMAMGIGPGDEVLVPAFTFFGTAGSVARVGAVPVWVDVLPDTFNINLADALDKVSPKTKAIMPVHLYGQPAEMECVGAFARKFGLRVIEDVAQAIGARYHGRKVGSIGDCGALSFYPTKNLGGFGDGGMLVTNDDALAERFIWLRNHGMHPKYYHKYIGGNFRLDSLQAALLRVKLPHLDTYHEARRAHASAYTEQLQGHGGVVRPTVIDASESVWNQYTLRVLHGQRDAFREHLQGYGIGSEIYYPLGLHRQECFSGLGRGGESLPVTDQLAAEVVSIPVFPEMTVAERDTVLEAIWAFGYPD